MRQTKTVFAGTYGQAPLDWFCGACRCLSGYSNTGRVSTMLNCGEFWVNTAGDYDSDKPGLERRRPATNALAHPAIAHYGAEKAVEQRRQKQDR